MEEQTPDIDLETGTWNLTEWDINCLAIGVGIISCGGGGSTNTGRLRAIRALKDSKKIRVITPEWFARNSKPNQYAVNIGFMGAPTIWNERICNGQEPEVAIKKLEEINFNPDYDLNTGEMHGIDKTTLQEENGVIFNENYQERDQNKSSKDKIVALIDVEIGGTNGMEAFIAGALMDLPVLDCDLMGRAFPELQMCTHFMYGVPPFPASLVSHYGQCAICFYAQTPKKLEDVFRRITVGMGCAAAFVERPITPAETLTKTVLHSVSRVWRLGCTVLKARRHKTSPVEAILQHEGGKLLCTGKIYDVQRKTEGGFAKGTLKLEGFMEFDGISLSIDFQNENLVAKIIGNGENDRILACTPDLISIVDLETGEPIATEEVRYGLRVAVLAISAAPILRTETALKVVGPVGFGYSTFEYKPFENYIPHPPVGPI